MKAALMFEVCLLLRWYEAETGERTDPDFMTNSFGRAPRCFLWFMHHPQTQIHLPPVHTWGVSGGPAE